MCASMCTCQRSVSLGHCFSRAISLCLELTNQAGLADQWAAEIYLSFPSLVRDYRNAAMSSFLLHGFWGLNLDPQACVANTTPAELSTQLSEVIVSMVGQQHRLRSNRNIKLHNYVFKNVWLPTHTPSTYTCFLMVPRSESRKLYTLHKGSIAEYSQPY